MIDSNKINSIMLEWAFRSADGMVSGFSTEKNLTCLLESLVEHGIAEDVSVDIVNDVALISEKGKHPERQAYNKKGILVTFPTPEYKQRAIAAGTHFEKNPVSAQSNLFGGGQQAPSQPQTPGQEPAVNKNNMDAGQSSLPPSSTTQPQTPPAQKDVPEPGAPNTPTSPAPAPSSAQAPATGTPAQGQLAVEPTPTTPAAQNVSSPAQPKPEPVVNKTPEELSAEKQVIAQILNGDRMAPQTPDISAGLSEQLRSLTKIALEMQLTEAVVFLSKHL
jgi:hypothetical protein